MFQQVRPSFEGSLAARDLKTGTPNPDPGRIQKVEPLILDSNTPMMWVVRPYRVDLRFGSAQRSRNVSGSVLSLWKFVLANLSLISV